MKEHDKQMYIHNTTRKSQKICREHCDYYYQNVRLKLTDLNQCYAKPSQAKKDAWNDCKRLCYELDGYDLCISGYSCDFFSVVFKFKVYGRECYAYITAMHKRFSYAN